MRPCCTEGRLSLSLKEVQATLSYKELNEKFEVKVFDVGDGLVARSKSSTNDNKGGRRRSKNDRNASSIRYYHYKKEEHIRRFCPERQRKATNLNRLTRFGK